MGDIVSEQNEKGMSYIEGDNAMMNTNANIRTCDVCKLSFEVDDDPSDNTSLVVVGKDWCQTTTNYAGHVLHLYIQANDENITICPECLARALCASLGFDSAPDKIIPKE